MTNICVCWYCRADLFNDEQIQGVIQYEPPWDAEYKEWKERNKVSRRHKMFSLQVHVADPWAICIW